MIAPYNLVLLYTRQLCHILRLVESNLVPDCSFALPGSPPLRRLQRHLASKFAISARFGFGDDGRETCLDRNPPDPVTTGRLFADRPLLIIAVAGVGFETSPPCKHVVKQTSPTLSAGCRTLMATRDGRESGGLSRNVREMAPRPKSTLLDR